MDDFELGELKAVRLEGVPSELGRCLTRAGVMWQVSARALVRVTAQMASSTPLNQVQVTTLAVSPSGNHCIVVCPDQLLYSHLNSNKVL